MTSIPSITGATVASAPSQKQLGTTDFLKLLTKQLEQQDPFAPQDNTQMIAQMAQMSVSSATAEMSNTLKTISSQLTTQSELLAKLAAQSAPPATPAA